MRPASICTALLAAATLTIVVLAVRADGGFFSSSAAMGGDQCATERICLPPAAGLLEAVWSLQGSSFQ